MRWTRWIEQNKRQEIRKEGDSFRYKSCMKAAHVFLRDIVIASRNRQKIDELIKLMQMFVAKRTLPSIRLVPLWMFDTEGVDIVEVVENGQSFEDNALLKAKAAYKKTKKVSLGEDTGLVVPVLGGAPGLRSARYAGEGSSMEQCVQKLMKQMCPYACDSSQREAFFHTSIVLYWEENMQQRFVVAEGRGYGRLATKPCGTKGFGYDCLFIPKGYKKRTFGELGLRVKNKISHRSLAVQDLLQKLEVFFDC